MRAGPLTIAIFHGRNAGWPQCVAPSLEYVESAALVAPDCGPSVFIVSQHPCKPSLVCDLGRAILDHACGTVNMPPPGMTSGGPNLESLVRVSQEPSAPLAESLGRKKRRTSDGRCSNEAKPMQPGGPAAARRCPSISRVSRARGRARGLTTPWMNEPGAPRRRPGAGSSRTRRGRDQERRAPRTPSCERLRS